MFYGLEGLPILLTEPTWNPPANREKTLELFIEKYGRPAVGLRDNGSLALYAAGLMTGVTVDIGDSGTSVTPIFNGTPTAVPPKFNTHTLSTTFFLGKDIQLHRL